MSEVTKPACETCRWLRIDPPHCVRFPPTVGAGDTSSFPLVRLDWSCGEYRKAAPRA